MPVEYLSAEQEARYGLFAGALPGELEQFFRPDTRASEDPPGLAWGITWNG
ncbi:hypothetical protein [Streptomyces mirabilis]|uniref:hypothetical protein n=1 Tax=Streptomyces mirabilis TaxID=68239 RepID=UPI0033AF3239